jgi:hypothetical protein
MDGEIISYVVAVVLERRRIKWQEPDCGDAEIFQILELARKAAKIPHAVVVAIVEGPDMGFVDDGVFIPEGVIGQRRRLIHENAMPPCHKAKIPDRVRIIQYHWHPVNNIS